MTWDLIQGDSFELLKKLPEASVDAVVCDPPYGLKFMDKDFDKLGEGAQQREWHKGWAKEALHVLKPGGFLLAFGGSRTFHHLASAVEEAGFEIRDCVMWLYGSGFPKSHDISKAIDKAAGAKREVVGSGVTGAAYTRGDRRNADEGFEGGQVERDITAPATPEAEQWQGWGTALKPAHEPIVVARKPFKGTVVKNVLAWGTGSLNIDGCRIGPTTQGSGDSSKGIGGKADPRGCPVHGLRRVRKDDQGPPLSAQKGETTTDVREGLSVEGNERQGQSEVNGRGLDD